jgi:hypothetical protein
MHGSAGLSEVPNSTTILSERERPGVFLPDVRGALQKKPKFPQGPRNKLVSPKHQSNRAYRQT